LTGPSAPVVTVTTVSRDPQDDERIYRRLGFAVSKGQMLELAMVRLAEAEKHDLASPLDDRWDEITRWREMPAGQLQRLLSVPEVIAADLSAAIGRRNRVVHEAWIGYRIGDDSRASADAWAPFLDEEAEMLQLVVRGVVRLRILREDGDPTHDELVEVWREEVQESIEPRPDRE
jgi:hypothetical protein